MQKYVKDFKTFIFEAEQTIQNDKANYNKEKVFAYVKQNDPMVKVKQISPYESIIRFDIYTNFKSEFKRRGGDETTNNPDVIAKGEDMTKLDISKDSERLEYAFRYITKDVNEALKIKNLVIDGKNICSNIREEIVDSNNSNIVFDFTFENEDSVNAKKEKMKGKTEKKLAGVIETKIDKTTKEVQVVSITLNSDIVVDVMNPTPKDALELANTVAKCKARGMVNVQGTYKYTTEKKVIFTEMDKIGEKLIEYKASSPTLATPTLYVKYGVDPVSKQQDIEVITKNKDLNIDDPQFNAKATKGKYTTLAKDKNAKPAEPVATATATATTESKKNRLNENIELSGDFLPLEKLENIARKLRKDWITIKDALEEAYLLGKKDSSL